MTASAYMIEDDVGLVERRSYTSTEPLPLESGATLAPYTLAYETYGSLDQARSNAILIMHALSGDAHAAGRHHPTDRKPGWWDAMIGPSKAFDTDRYFVICANVIGGCQGSTGPSSIDPRTGRRYNLRFPVITISDMVNAQARLLDYLGIDQLLAVIGGSMGGMQVLQFAVNFPDRVRLAVALSTAARSSAQAIAWSTIGRRAIMADPRWRNGDYAPDAPPVDGLSIARMIGHMTYMSEERLEWRFDRQLQDTQGFNYTLQREFAVESYLDYQGRSFVDRFDANSYLYITKALDYWDLTRGGRSLSRVLARTEARFVVASFSSDWLYPPAESEAIVGALRDANRPVVYHALPSPLGHDAFLLEYETLTPLLAEELERVYEM
jgi:homoserine O-acetyltransferase/O-succinyltransferase